MFGRVPKWERALTAEYEASLRRPFRWHANDCCAFAARCVLAITGHDPFLPFVGAYSGPRTAQRVLKAHGGIVGICDALFGPREVPLRAQRGDLVLVTESDADGVAVCLGRAAFMPGKRGLVARPQSEWRAAWRVV